MLGINYSSFERTPPPHPPFFLLNTTKPTLLLFSFKLSIELHECFADTEDTLADITVWFHYFHSTLYKSVSCFFFHICQSNSCAVLLSPASVTQRKARRLRASSLSPICILFCHYTRLQVQLLNATQQPSQHVFKSFERKRSLLSFI